MRFATQALFALALGTVAEYVNANGNQGWDYIIIGAGPHGLTLANRLSANPSNQVLVLEAGNPHINDSAILIPGYVGGTLGNPEYDWEYTTIPQPDANNRSALWSRGKGLGGSTQVNFMAWGRPSSGELDSLEQLGNPGWNWTNLLKYMKKAETFQTPSHAEAAQWNLTWNPSVRGNNGPVKTSFSSFISDAQRPWEPALNALGVPTVQDPMAGDDVGVWESTVNIDNNTKARSYATNALYLPVENRPNLQVLTGAFVSRILFPSNWAQTSNNGGVVASGVEYFANSTRKVANLNRGGEVIVSAGTIASPKVLELSGIGDPHVLNPLDIPVVVNLPGVGNGVVDQLYFGASYELKDSSVVTLDNLRNTTYAAQALAQYEANRTGLLTIGVSAFTLVPLEVLAGTQAEYNTLIANRKAYIANSNESQATKTLQQIQLNQLENPQDYGLVELVAFPGFFTTKSVPEDGKKYITFTIDYQLPWSRGSIHVQSTNYTVQPAINPNYLVDDFDLEVLSLGLKFARKISQSAGFKQSLGPEIDPGAAVATDAEIKAYIQEWVGTEYHTIGSCAMLPQAMNGVVSPQLLVYGTQNIRVVDYSIMPIQLTAHPQSTIYAVAEKAADIILGVTTV